ncbi:MAG TPA: phage holin family protein [Pirellulaceae bacterium]|nr:phage holin family protein [Pirellulaceae bacterium]
MVDRPAIQTNGRDKTDRDYTAPRAVAHNLSELMHDALTLGDLQLRLAWLDARLLSKELVYPGVLLLVGVTVVLSCVPIALATIALALDEATRLTAAQAFGFTLAGGLVVGAVTALAAVLWIRRGVHPFRRSIAECDANVQWIKKVLQQNIGAARKSRPIDESAVI